MPSDPSIDSFFKQAHRGCTDLEPRQDVNHQARHLGRSRSIDRSMIAVVCLWMLGSGRDGGGHRLQQRPPLAPLGSRLSNRSGLRCSLWWTVCLNHRSINPARHVTTAAGTPRACPYLPDASATDRSPAARQHRPNCQFFFACHGRTGGGGGGGRLDGADAVLPTHWRGPNERCARAGVVSFDPRGPSIIDGPRCACLGLGRRRCRPVVWWARLLKMDQGRRHHHFVLSSHCAGGSILNPGHHHHQSHNTGTRTSHSIG